MNPSPSSAVPRGLPLPAALGLAARGATADEALPLPARINGVSTVASGADGVRLPANGDIVFVRNESATALKVYPPPGAQIDALGVDAAFTVDATTSAIFSRGGGAQWYAGEWAAPPASYSDEQAQDAVGGMVVGTGDVPLAYNDGTPSLSASLNLTGMTAETNIDLLADTLPFYDASATANRKMIGKNKLCGLNLRRYAIWESDWLAQGSAHILWGGTTPSYITGEAGHPGIARLTSSSVATVRIDQTNSTGVLFGAGKWLFQSIVRLNAVGDVTDNYGFRSGFSDGSGIGDGVDDLLFRYNYAVNSGKWECVARANSVETASDSGITVVATDWYHLEIEVNADATSVTFRINGADVATVTTNIPTGAGRNTGMVPMACQRTAGTNARTFDLDAHSYFFQATTAR